MNYAEFLEAVGTRAGLPPTQAAIVTRATLATLSERLSGGEADDVAGQLPEELRGYLHKGVDFAEPLDLVQFRSEIGARVGMTDERAGEAARAVLTTLREAVSADEVGDLEVELPYDIRQLLHPAGGGEA